MKDKIKMFEIDNAYINYLVSRNFQIFHNKQNGQINERKYIGIVLNINNMDYFAPLSSFKPKHNNMKDSIDFIKVGTYAVINLNNMFPVPNGKYTYVNFSSIVDYKYKTLLLKEYNYIKGIQVRIKKNAAALYNIIVNQKNDENLLKRCNDFAALEKACIEYYNYGQ